jgi:polysaccharide deacetylase 2 family uncharacterized protein YibQ
MYKMKFDKKTRVALLILMLLALLMGTYALARLIFRHKPNIPLLVREIDSAVSTSFSAAGVKPSAIRKNSVAKQNGTFDWEQIEVIATLGETESIDELGAILRQRLHVLPVVVKEERKGDASSLRELQLSVYFDKAPIYQILLKREPAAPFPKHEPPAQDRPRIALIIDDVGYDVDRALKLLNLRRPMSISIFPQLKYSRHVAEVAHDMGYMVMMHLPMEPGENLRRNPGFIAPEMSENEMRWILDRNFESIPHVSGVNNHQGSKMTRNKEAMARVMQYLAEKDMFFVDSRTTSDSVAYRVAKASGLRAAENDMFLDNEKNVEYIKERLELLMREAEQKGEAIGICHVHPATLQALKDMLPVMDERGFELVHVSELLK